MIDEVDAAGGEASGECAVVARIGTLCRIEGKVEAERFGVYVGPQVDDQKYLAGKVEALGGVGIHAELALGAPFPARATRVPLPP